MQRFLRYGGLLAAAGFVASLTLHLLALGRVGFRSPAFAVALHAGILALGVPLIFVLMQRVALGWQIAKIQALFAACPRWMKEGNYVVVVYFLMNVAILLYRDPRGDLARAHRYEIPPSVLAFATAGWILGYYLLSEIFYALVKTPVRFCLRGHPVRIGDARCPKCASPVRGEAQDKDLELRIKQ